jgi:hypothetical protein
LATLPFAIKLIKEMNKYNGERLNETLALTAKLSVLFSFLFSIGIAL